MFTLKFETSNESFSEDTIEECFRILESLARQIEFRTDCNVFDSNGNVIGKWSLTK